MRALSLLLIGLGICLAAFAGYDEYRGATTKPFSILTRRHSGYLYRLQVQKENNADLFRQFMTGHWLYVAAFSIGGGVLLIREVLHDSNQD